MHNTAYKQWRAFGGAMVCASHICSCTWTSDRLEIRHCSYAKTLAATFKESALIKIIDKRMLRVESTAFLTRKIETIGLLLVSLVFIVLGLLMILIPFPDSVFAILRNRVFVIVVGSVNIVFFGFGFLIFLLQLFGYSLKLNKIKIDATGITDKYRVGSYGHIPWIDIKGVKINTINDQRYLTILVHNPTSYIDKQRTLEERKNAELNCNLTGSPINIKTGLLGFNIDKLKNKIETKLKEYK